ncbi:hypothetical protein M758_9G134300 [Ceratodon purpureus]|nr:hypothetical protein M758_9G134300 [Ceratodon purpureus]
MCLHVIRVVSCMMLMFVSLFFMCGCGCTSCSRGLMSCSVSGTVGMCNPDCGEARASKN